jgi:ABC-type transporter Mla MlaB component
MSLVFDLWQTCQLEQGRYHTYIFDLGRVEELHDSGLTWLMMFQRWATKAKIGVRLMNYRSDVGE